MFEKMMGNTLVLRLEIGEEIMSSVKEACKKHGIKGGYITGIGALKKTSVGVFNMETKKYTENSYSCFCELLAICGNVSVMNGDAYIHLHATLADESGKSFGGHLTEGVVGATAEIFITDLKGEINRIHDNETGLNVFDI